MQRCISSVVFRNVMALIRCCWVLLIPLLLAVSTTGQDANFGLKVKCYVRDGTVLCPGCNSRQGLTCPRNLKVESCNVKPQTPYPTRQSYPTGAYDDRKETSTAPGVQDTHPKNTTDLGFRPVQQEIDWEALAKDVEFRLFVYHILRPYVKHGRFSRDVRAQEEDVCDWNGDCPCPLICCKNGDGCPKRCMLGIRLPPPWG